MYKKQSIPFQLLFGVIFGILNFLVYCLQVYNPVPLYMDTLFTVTASFFGWISGFICATLLHVFCFVFQRSGVSSIWWAICSYSVVLIIRLFVNYQNKDEKRKTGITEILVLIFITTFVISLEGAIIFTLLHAFAQYREDSQVRQMFLLLNRNSFPVFTAALLPRIPVNILDKGICVSLGYLAYLGTARLLERLSKKAS